MKDHGEMYDLRDLPRKADKHCHIAMHLPGFCAFHVLGLVRREREAANRRRAMNSKHRGELVNISCYRATYGDTGFSIT